MKIAAKFLLCFLFHFSFRPILAAKNQSIPKVLFVTTPKSGTHLLKKTICLILETENYQELGFSLVHIEPKYCKMKEGKIAVLIRDPRDIFISQLYLMEQYPWRENHPWLENKEVYNMVNSLPVDERLAWIIQHPEQYFGVHDYIKMSTKLMINPNVSVFRFEDLVGPQGGGDRLIQENTIEEIALLMGYSLSRNKIMYIADHLFGGTNSFRKGQIGTWASHFSCSNKELFKHFLGQDLINLGYAVDNDW